ncbi:uncharacterized protein LOC106151192 isoform X2 [Lingula anatina]|uniref:Uncharacterized protein LOC106151192 isoform X2 n=1 Tax=Lingula anatina TaxID=7574 RepID=A0A1S3H0U2_LINAN|nr:uncharacterized protein LOC106151192 isoform X2 [Lingula anatina]|eukprot:XP_013379755.1 uncharacterized protein LOC106151192 isoform X2 [Lingula anatina]
MRHRSGDGVEDIKTDRQTEDPSFMRTENNNGQKSPQQKVDLLITNKGRIRSWERPGIERSRLVRPSIVASRRLDYEPFPRLPWAALLLRSDVKPSQAVIDMSYQSPWTNPGKVFGTSAGKFFGLMKEAQSKHLERMNRMYLLDDRYRDVDHLQEKLHVYKNLFLEFDENGSGDIDALELKRMLQKLGVHRTNLEIRRMIAEVDSDSSE